MITSLDLTMQIADINAMMEDLDKKIRALFKSVRITKDQQGDLKRMRRQYSVLKKRKAYLEALIPILESGLGESNISHQRTQLQIKMRAIGERCAQQVKNDIDCQDELDLKNKEIRKRLKAELSKYKYEHMKEQIKAMNFILRN